MGWQDYHQHAFHISDFRSEDIFFDIPEDSNLLADVFTTRNILPDLVNKVSKSTIHFNPTFKYIYDFGDWCHTIKLEKVLRAEEVSYPRCIGGKRSSPLEYCGGLSGYKNLLEVLADPENEEYDKMRDWADSMKDGPFDPEKFNPSEVLFDDPKEKFKRAFQEKQEYVEITMKGTSVND
jgi:hypothetical protein